MRSSHAPFISLVPLVKDLTLYDEARLEVCRFLHRGRIVGLVQNFMINIRLAQASLLVKSLIHTQVQKFGILSDADEPMSLPSKLVVTAWEHVRKSDSPADLPNQYSLAAFALASGAAAIHDSARSHNEQVLLACLGDLLKEIIEAHDLPPFREFDFELIRDAEAVHKKLFFDR